MTSSQFCSHGNLWPAAQRARDEAIIEATLCLYLGTSPYRASRGDIDAIIATVGQEQP